jgi:tripartite-type tricarboxylate transporter receptor subunit TctC
MTRRRRRILLKSTFVAACAAQSFAALAAEPDFKGKTIRIIVGTTAGGFYDNVGRVLARHLPDRLPGRPNIVVENMPGASGLQAANYLATAAPKDGTVLSVFNKSLPLYEALATPGVRFSSRALSWIGAVTQTQDAVVVWRTSSVRTLEDAKRQDVVFGAVSVVGTTFTYPAILNAFLGTKIRIVTGYAGGLAVDHGMEQGEIEGRGSNQWSTWKFEHPSWVSEKKIIPILQIGLHREPDLPDVPMLSELGVTPIQKAVFKLFSDAAAFDGPLVGPPDLPPETLGILRKAFDEVGRDPAYIKDATALGLEPDPLSGAVVGQIVDRIEAAPLPTVDAVKKAIAAQSAAMSTRK